MSMAIPQLTEIAHELSVQCRDFDSLWAGDRRLQLEISL